MGRILTANRVAARLARAWLARHRAALAPHAADLRVGAFTLRPAQRDTVDAISAAFDAFGGALLADPPGTGKTIIALAVAARHDGALVLAPATLRAQWLRAAARARVAIRFHSLESLSRSATPPRAALVIVDEAHQARTPGTRRYSRLAECCIGARVLLLTATPVVNRGADRDALLALFLGGRHADPDPAAVARCVLRHEGAAGARPRIVRLAPLTADSIADVAGLAEALSRLPPPLPAADGTDAVALVRITLAMAWSSSLAALDAALRRRQQRGRALRDALGAGRWPSRAALRQWVHGDDATQLAFPELEVPAAGVDAGAAIARLDTHLAAVDALRALIRDRIATDTFARAEALRRLARAHPGRRIAVFARHADTVRALWRALAHDPGTIAITGTRAVAAHGRWSRSEVLDALGPRGAPLREGDPRAIRLLLTTDLLAEGVELQGVELLVHADRAWTPSRLEQREGRIARLGARTAEVRVTRFLAPAGAVPLLRLGARLARKRRARARSLATAAESEAIDRELGAWRAAWRAAGRGAKGTAAQVAVATAPVGPEAICLALVRRRGELALIAGRIATPEARWLLSESPRAVRRAVAAIGPCLLGESRAGGDPVEGDAPDATLRSLPRPLLRAIGRRERRLAGRLLLGTPPARRALVARVRARVDLALDRRPTGDRPAVAAALDDALERLAAGPGAGMERRLERALRDAASPEALLREVIALGAIAREGGRAKGDGPRSRLVALVLLLPAGAATGASVPPPPAPEPSRPSTSP